MIRREVDLINSGFITGGGEMGALIRAFDWQTTSLGPLINWPQSLRTTLGILLNSKFPMFLYWGPELLCFYNDAYRPNLGNQGKHPDALGRPGQEVWAETWHIIKPHLDNIISGGESALLEDQLLPIYRNGSLEGVYWSFSYSPVYEENGEVGGILVICTETTSQVRQKQEDLQKLALAIEATELATWELDPITNKFIADDRYAEWHGLAANQVTEISQGMDIIVEKDRERVLVAFNNALDPSIKNTYDVEYTIRPLNKPERTLRAKGKVWFNEYDIAQRFTGTLQDVTQQKLALENVEKSEQQVRAIIESTPFPIGVFLGKDMQIHFANKAIRDAWGKGQDVIGKRYKELLPELETQEVFKQLEQVFTTGNSFQAKNQKIEIVIDGKSQTFYYNYSFVPLYNAEGQVYGIVKTAINVTDLVLAHQKIEESEETLKRFKFMADKARDAFILMREDGTFAYLNQKALQEWGYTEEEAKHIRVPDVDPIYNDEVFSDAFARAQKETIPQFETLHKRKDGQIYPVEVNMGALVLGDEPYMFAVARNITERKKVAEDLEQKNMELIQINNDLDNFIYTASHDLKAPISNIEALLQALLRKLPKDCLESERTQHITSLMQGSIERFKKTIANLTEVVKLQKENNGEAVSVDFVQVLREVSLDLESLIQSSAARIEKDITESCIIHFSEKNLRSLVYNLLSNAIKYRSPERVPIISIKCEQIDGFHRLTIADNGLGMKQEQTSKLFTMFKRFHDHVEGTGIGLYMVKKMVENVNGYIEVDSQEGFGTTFKVYFPR